MNYSTIPVTLPDRLKGLVAEIESKAGQPICWMEDKALQGAMSNNVLEGCPIIFYRDITEEGAAHELLHLRLTYHGFPRLLCPENLNITRQVMMMLEGVTQHIVIFPQLKDWGYNPYNEETKGIWRQLDSFREADFSRIASEPCLRALYAMVYVRAWIESEEAGLQAEVERIYTDSRLQACRTLASGVIDILRARRLNKHQETYSALREAIEFLGQSDEITIEYPLELATDTDQQEYMDR